MSKTTYIKFNGTDDKYGYVKINGIDYALGLKDGIVCWQGLKKNKGEVFTQKSYGDSIKYIFKVKIYDDNTVAIYDFVEIENEVTPTVTVTFDIGEGIRTGGGSLIQTIGVGESAVLPIVEKPNQILTNWDRQFTNIGADVTINAEYSDSYIVTFDIGEGTRIGGGELIQTVVKNGIAIAPIITKEGYVLSGWDKTFIDVTANIIITAEYLPTYVVTFDIGDGERIGGGALVQTITTGGYASSVNVIKEGYVRTGWSTSLFNVISSKTITAVYKKVYTVTFELDGGTRIGGGALVQTVLGDNNAVAPVVEKTGYALVDWDKSFNNVADDITTIAQYLETYTVTFDIGDGERIGGGALVQTITTGGDAITPLVNKTGYDFSDWDTSLLNIIGDTIITAQYTVYPTYTVTFELDGGTRTGGGALVQEIIKGNSATAPIVTKSEQNLIGWNNELTNIVDNITITAQYASVVYTVTFNIGTGTRTGGGALVQTIESGGTAIAPVVSKTGYSNTWSSVLTNVTENKTFNAVYISAYTVTFSLNGGTRTGGGALVQYIAPNGTAIAPTVNKIANTLSGWNKSLTNITASQIITALYTTATYTVTFELDGGTRIDGGALVQTVSYLASAVSPIVTKEGYVRTGWDKSISNITANITITAVYTIAHTVTFELDGGTRTGAGAVVQYIISGGTAIAPTVIKSGYVHSSWDKVLTNITANTTITAIYTTAYTVTFDIGTATRTGGGVLVQSIISGGTAIAPTVINSGYYNNTWDSELTNITASKTIKLKLVNYVAGLACSNDGWTWEISKLASGLYSTIKFDHICWNGNIAVGISGKIMYYSYDCINWTKIKKPYLKDVVCWNGTMFVALSDKVETPIHTDIYIPGVVDNGIANYINVVYGQGNFSPLLNTTYSFIGVTVDMNDDVYVLANHGVVYKKAKLETQFTVYYSGNLDSYKRYTGITHDYNGNLYICSRLGEIRKQTNGIGDFVLIDSFPARNYSGITSDGTDIYACVFGGDIYKKSCLGADGFVATHSTIKNYVSITTGFRQSAAIYSYDGIEWHDGTLDSSIVHMTFETFGFVDVCWGDSKFVAVGIYGQTLNSTDGINWVTYPLGIENAGGICYNGSKFIVTNGRPGLYYSLHGTSWTAVYGNVIYGKICWNGTMFVVSSWQHGWGETIHLLGYSYDGIIWYESANADSFFGSVEFNIDVIHDGEKFIAIGRMICATSTDGITWTAVTVPSLGNVFSKNAPNLYPPITI